MVLRNMNVEPMSFNFKGNNVRSKVIDGKVYFVAKDVAKAIGYKDTVGAVKKHVKNKYKLGCQIGSSGQKREMTMISEPGIYEMATKSRLPQAEPFQDWVFDEVLPSINHTGEYKREQSNNADLGEFADKIPSTYSDALMLAGQAMKQHEKDKPKLDYYEKAMNNPALVTTSEISMSYGMSAIALNKFLHRCHVIYKRGKTWMLYQEYKGKGYADFNTFNGNKNGKPIASNILKWTQRGQRMIDKLLADHGIYRNLTLDMDVTSELPGKLD